MTEILKQRIYKPFRDDLPLGLHTWLFYVVTFFGFVLISVATGVGVFWGILTSLVISFFSHSAWRSSVTALLMKRFFTKSLFGFVVDVIRKRSFQKAAEEMLNVSEDAESEFQEIIQRESRWLVVIPTLMLSATIVLDWLIDVSLRYFLIAEGYFVFVGLAWMLMCRQGRLAMLPIGTSDG